MYAIISDIHANLEALTAVLDAINAMGPRRILCLGDLVGYGPDSMECVRRSAAFDVCLMGDWDILLAENTQVDWNPTLRRHIEYLRGEFANAADSEFLLATLRTYQNEVIDSGVHYTHGTPCDRNEWIFPEDVYNTEKLHRIANYFHLACICGHAHLNGIYQRDSTGDWIYTHPELGQPYPLLGCDKTIITVGSVGQPRDGDPRAAFATVEENQVTFHRVEYDVETTVRKITKNPALDNMFGERLRSGR